MAKQRITDDDLCRAAKRLRTGTAEIQTFLAVETRGKGFDERDRPVILFERHWFHKLTKGRFTRQHPDISNPDAGGYGKESEQYARFSKAFRLDPIAAMKSASWGRGQVMGFNHAIVGYPTVGEFVDAMKHSEGKQLDASVEYILYNNLDDELRRHDWRGFARGYNGPKSAQNDYHNKLARAFAKYSKGPQVVCPGDSQLVNLADLIEEPDTEQYYEELTDIPTNVSDPTDEIGSGHSDLIEETGDGSNLTTPQPLDTSEASVEVTQKQETTTAGGTESVEVTQKNEQNVNEKVAMPGPEPYQGIGFWAVIKRDLALATGGNLTFEGVSTYAQQASGWPEWVIALIGKLAVGVLIASFGYLGFRVIHFLVDSWKQKERVRLLATINSDITRRDVELH